MKIDHIAMYVDDLDAMKNFFERYFKAVPNKLYNNSKNGFKSYFLSFDDNTRLEIMNKLGMIGERKLINNMGLIHIAFSVGSKEKVDEITGQLKSDGYEVISGPRVTGDGYYESCVLGPENNQIEITV